MVPKLLYNKPSWSWIGPNCSWYVCSLLVCRGVCVLVWLFACRLDVLVVVLLLFLLLLCVCFRFSLGVFLFLRQLALLQFSHPAVQALRTC
jgi:hypothetical protein